MVKGRMTICAKRQKTPGSFPEKELRKAVRIGQKSVIDIPAASAAHPAQEGA
jgi:hypothetical protein